MRYSLPALYLAFLLGINCSALTYSQTPKPQAPSTPVASEIVDSKADAEAIHAAANAFTEAFNKQDAQAVAAFWTKDGEYIDDTGREYLGREAIAACYSELLAARPGAKLQLILDSVRVMGGNVAIENGRAVVEPAPAGASGISSYTAVHVKVDGKWLMASVRDTWSDESSTNNDLADLEFLVGEWTAEENGARTESKCRWLSNKKFVERSYTTTQLDGTVASGLQIFGWNPQTKQMQSWNFSADGGHAIGVLSAIEGGWMAKVNGTTGEGISTTATNALKRLDDNAYAWQSTNRSLGGTELPDTDEVVLRRKPTAR